MFFGKERSGEGVISRPQQFQEREIFVRHGDSTIPNAVNLLPRARKYPSTDRFATQDGQKTETVMTFNEEVTMTQVLVVCAAGASSTFLARRLTDLASARRAHAEFCPEPRSITIPDDPRAIVAISAHVATRRSARHIDDEGDKPRRAP